MYFLLFPSGQKGAQYERQLKVNFRTMHCIIDLPDPTLEMEGDVLTINGATQQSQLGLKQNTTVSCLIHPIVIVKLRFSIRHVCCDYE